ncbi:MAG: hypothetical protein QOE66_2433 [Chloroflexota bacterium]|jgi:hypothetical protein|nr:hypothetical protein [Chloroflexota bacterium]
MSKRRIQRTNRPQRPRIRTLLQGMDRHGLAWDDVADEILPVFERARPFSYDVEAPAQAVVPPGVTVGFGIDLGLAFARVAAAHLDDWPVDLPGLTDRALRNLRHRARHASDYDLVSDAIGGIPTVVFQSRDGWASTAILVPEAIERFFGSGPALFIAPSRDLLVGLPVDVDLEFATWLAEEFEAEDPNALRLEAFEWRDRTVRCRPLQRETVAV